MDAPLAGCTVLSTRPEAEEDSLGPALRAAGAQVLRAPMIAFGPPPDPDALAAALAAPWDAVLLTSPRAVAAVADGLRAGAAVVALSAATRRHAHAAGLNVLDLPDARDGRDLAQVMAARMRLAGTRMLLPTSQRSEAAVADGLRAAGAHVEVVLAYQTRSATAVDPAVLEALRAGQVHAVVAMSPSAVETLVQLVDPALLRPLLRAAPGATTARAWDAAGLPAQAVATSPAAGEVVAALGRAWASLRR